MPEHVIGPLLEGLKVVPLRGARDCRAVRIVEDSRLVEPGVIFLARPGATMDGREFIEQAQAAGAVAVLSDAQGCTLASGPALEAVDVSEVGARLAHRLAGNPSHDLPVIGVTGTNGKSTLTMLLRHVLGRDSPCALMGGIEIDDGQRTARATLTTPFAADVAHWLGQARLHGCRHAVMEVSSHALDQDRVLGVQFATAVFTNLSGDHLDYHGTIEAYAACKRRLFERLDSGSTAIINLDDPRGASMTAEASCTIIGCSLSNLGAVRGHIEQCDADGLALKVDTPWGSTTVRSGLVGRHNAMNLLQVVAVAGAHDVELDVIAHQLASAAPPPGRLEPVPGPAGAPRVFVDFAHTDDALRAVLRAVRELVGTDGRLVVVLGCGGDRDRTKRPRMGEVAAALADEAWITSDNPRTESPALIAGHVHAGVAREHHDRVHVEIDRRTAIESAITRARSGDIVVITGKGHETEQLLGDVRVPFDDRVEAARVLNRHCARNMSSLGHLADLAGAEFVGDKADVVVRGVGTDTREDLTGRLFIAIKGPNFDGHDYLGQALAGGAAAALVRRGVALPVGLAGLLVDDPINALGQLGTHWRDSMDHLRVVGITGTAGKTTTKDILATVCRESLETVSSPRSFNNDLGVPLTMLDVRSTDEVLIAEVGTSSPGEIAPLAAMIRPDVAIVTLVGRGHLEKLGDLEAVAREKYALIEGMSPGSVAFIRHQDFAVPACACTVQTFGLESGADHCLQEFGVDDRGAWMQFENRRWPIGVPGKHGALDAVAALLAARALGCSDETIATGLALASPPAGRLHPVLIDDMLLIDDSWNANPESMEAAIDVLGHLVGRRPGRRIVILGDMLELGAGASEHHEALARPVAALDGAIGLYRVILVGELIEAARDELCACLGAGRVEHVACADEDFIESVVASLEPGDSVLIKGSRGMGLDRIIERCRSRSAMQQAAN